MALTRDEVFWSAFSAHADITVRATALLQKMLEHPADSDPEAQEIAKLERQGDKITHDTVQALHQTWITPLDREYIHSLMSHLDDVLDYLEAASDRVMLYKPSAPNQEAIALAKVLVLLAEATAKAVKLLTNLKHPEALLALCNEIDRYEHDADEIYRHGVARLFKEEKDPFEVMKWKDILESLENAADSAEDVANIIEGIVLEHG